MIVLVALGLLIIVFAIVGLVVLWKELRSQPSAEQIESMHRLQDYWRRGYGGSGAGIFGGNRYFDGVRGRWKRRRWRRW